ncbi:MAG: hypothetical protein EXS32_08960 [Opitutus sp.]|nr:hypothetical protein [Opitutus sp.]
MPVPGAAAPAAEGAAKAPPPFPVIAPPTTGTTTPPMVVAAATAPAVGKPPITKKVPLWKKKGFQIGALAAVLVLGAGGYFAFSKMFAPPPPPPVVKAKPATPAKAAPPTAAQAALADKVAATPPAAAAPLTPSDTLNNLAHAPVNAINKAKKVADARGGSDAVDGVNALAAGDQPAEKGEPGAQKSAAPVVKTITKTTLAPGLTGTTTDVEAASEASPAFRSFVANAKISGVFQGTPPRVMINGRLARAGENVDPSLGIVFDGLDPEKKQIIFKDKTGAIVMRRY